MQAKEEQSQRGLSVQTHTACPDLNVSKNLCLKMSQIHFSFNTLHIVVEKLGRNMPSFALVFSLRFRQRTTKFLPKNITKCATVKGA